MNIAVLIAAAGQSSRMGSPKALLPINGEPALISLAKFFTGRPELKIFATLPPSLLAHQELRVNAELFGLQLRHNFYPELGYWGSIKTIVQEISPRADGLMINPVDAPGLSYELLSTIISLANNSLDPTIIVPYAYGCPAHPIYVSASFFAKLHQGPYTRLDQLIKANQHYLLRFGWHDLRILVNLNKVSDYLSYSDF